MSRCNVRNFSSVARFSLKSLKRVPSSDRTFCSTSLSQSASNLWACEKICTKILMFQSNTHFQIMHWKRSSFLNMKNLSKNLCENYAFMSALQLFSITKHHYTVKDRMKLNSHLSFCWHSAKDMENCMLLSCFWSQNLNSGLPCYAAVTLGINCQVTQMFVTVFATPTTGSSPQPGQSNSHSPTQVQLFQMIFPIFSSLIWSW